MNSAQCRAWIENADSFEKLGRYEARISRQMLQYTTELERLQQARRLSEHMAECEAERLLRALEEKNDGDDDSADRDNHGPSQTAETKPVDHKVASFRQTAPEPAPEPGVGPKPVRRAA